MRRLSILVVTVVAILTACSRPPGWQATPIPPPPPDQGLSTLAQQIVKHPEWYQGQQVTIVGYFRGLDLLDEVVMPPPTDRLNDWLVRDESGAIWVSYVGQLPFPTTSHEVWRVVRVTGTVEIYNNDMPYILPNSVQWEGLVQERSVLPALCRVAIHRYGGPDGLDHHTYWYETNSLVVDDQTTGWQAVTELRSGQVYDLQRALNRARFFALEPLVGEPCSDCIRYEIAAVEEKQERPHFVTTYEGSVPDKLQTLIDVAAELAADAQPIQ
jgi:hypothetical protein